MTKDWLKRLAVICIALYFAGSIVRMAYSPDVAQWDFRTNYFAAKAYAAGLSPYSKTVLSKLAEPKFDIVTSTYVYPYYTLLFFLPFTFVSFPTAFYLFLMLKIAVLLGLLYIWKEKFVKDDMDVFFYLFCLLAYSGAIFKDITCGNNTLFEQIMLWMAFFLFIKRRLVLFCGIIILLASWRITEIFFLLPLLLLAGREKYMYFKCSILIISIIVYVGYFASPQLYSAGIKALAGCFRASDVGGIFVPSTFHLVRYSSGTFSEGTGIAIPFRVQLGIYLALVTTIILVTLRAFIKLRLVRSKDSEKMRLFLLCIVYIMIIPYCSDYWYALAVVPTYFIIKRVDKLGPYLPLYLLMILSGTGLNVTIKLPGVGRMVDLLYNFSSLICAYLTWGLYLYIASTIIKSDSSSKSLA